MYGQLEARANRPASRKCRVRTALAGVLLALGTVGVCLLAGEAACRLAGYSGVEQYRPDHELGWVLEPGQSTVTTVGRLPVTINQQGFRDEPLASPKHPGAVRIFALGASTTFGWGVKQEEAYPQVLEQMLNDSARASGSPVRFEIVNAGVIGYNLWQVGRFMRRIAARYQPDGFIVAYTFNDGWNHAGQLTPHERERVLRGVQRKNLLRASALFNWLTGIRARRVARQAQQDRAPNALAIVQTADTTSSPAELATYQASVDSIIRGARDGGLALSFLVPIARGQPGTNQRQEAMIFRATAAGLPLIQLPPLSGAQDPDSIYLPDDAVHPTALGHALLAGRLYQSLCESARRAPEEDPARIYRPGCGGGAYNPRL
jgi:lysophospholipase L1-like esterase